MNVGRKSAIGAAFTALGLGLIGAVDVFWLGREILGDSWIKALVQQSISSAVPSPPAQVLLRLMPLFALLFWYGGAMHEGVSRGSVYAFLRAESRLNWFGDQLVRLFLGVCAYLLIGVAVYSAMLWVGGIRQFVPADLAMLMGALFFQMTSYFLVLLCANWLALRFGQVRAILCCFAAVSLSVVLAYASHQRQQALSFALNPVSNTFWTWHDAQVIGWTPEYFTPRFSAIYWGALAILLIDQFRRYFLRADLLDAPREGSA